MIQISDILPGLIVAFIIWIAKKIFLGALGLISMLYQEWNLSGCWFAEHGSYVSEDIKAIEIIYIWHNGERIKYRMEQYTNFEDNKRIFEGRGIIKAGVISSYYYPIDKKSKLIGCMNLQVKTKKAAEIYLSGTFYEVDERKEKLEDFKEYPDDFYKMYNINLDIMRIIKIKFFKNVFRSFREVEKYVSQYR